MGILSSALLLLAISIGPVDSNFLPSQQEQFSHATTGRILKIDLKARTIRVRPDDTQNFSVRNATQNVSQLMEGLKQRIGEVTLPGGITIPIPGRGKSTTPVPKPSDQETAAAANEFLVVLTKDTVFEDGAETIRLDNFRTGETISIHGSRNGSTITATRIAKWF